MWWTGFRSRLGSIPTSAQDDIIRYDVMVHDASARAHGTVPALPRLLRRLGTHQSCSRPFYLLPLSSFIFRQVRYHWYCLPRVLVSATDCFTGSLLLILSLIDGDTYCCNQAQVHIRRYGHEVSLLAGKDLSRVRERSHDLGDNSLAQLNSCAPIEPISLDLQFDRRPVGRVYEFDGTLGTSY